MNEAIKKVVDTIRLLGIDMIDEAQSGHPGIVLDAAPTLYTLYAYHMNINVKDEKWLNRDRFVMSSGHGSALLYSILYMSGFNIGIEDLKKFRQIDSITPGHPEYGKTPGVDASTGPLGQGFANAVGMALSERYLNNLFKKYNAKNPLIDHYTYCLCGDGDLMEGIANEAASFAGTQKLNKLIVLYDSNDISLDGETKKTFTENVLKKFEAMNWNTEYVKNGNDVADINKAIERAKKCRNAPTIIEIKTIIGDGSLNAGKNIVHGKPLTKEDISILKDKAGIRDVPFTVSKEASEYIHIRINRRVDELYENWGKNYNEIMNGNNEEAKTLLTDLMNNNININLDPKRFTIPEGYREELRESNSKILNIVGESPLFVGGSADLSSSCKTYLNEKGDMLPDNPLGKNIFFGVREHAMGGILNGMALSGLRVFGSTFLSFSDYVKPSIRMSALMNLPVTYIFTHDSVMIGEDGPTHEPVEQLSSLRLIPNLNVYRPGDLREVIGCWNEIITSKKPSALVVTKNDTEVIKGTDASQINKGGYIVHKEEYRLDGIIIATGSELKYASLIVEELSKMNLDLRIVSMPSVEIFKKQDKAYIEKVLPIGVKTAVIEAGSTPMWNEFTYNEKYIIGIDEFGYSGTKEDTLRKLNFDYASLKERVIRLFK